MTKLIELIPVVTSGTYYCEHGDCKVTQTDDDTEDMLFYGNNDGMYCREHVELYPIVADID
jgi:hypothetical protein